MPWPFGGTVEDEDYDKNEAERAAKAGATHANPQEKEEDKVIESGVPPVAPSLPELKPSKPIPAYVSPYPVEEEEAKQKDDQIRESVIADWKKRVKKTSDSRRVHVPTEIFS